MYNLTSNTLKLCSIVKPLLIKDLHESVIAKLQSSAKRKGCAIGKVYRMPQKDTNVIDRRPVTEITINVTFCIFILTSLLNIKL